MDQIEKLKEQEINAIAKDLCSGYKICTCIERNGHCVVPQRHARILYDLGYKKSVEGTWKNYSSTMMECSVCKKHVPWHRYKFCPECGSRMFLGERR